MGIRIQDDAFGPSAASIRKIEIDRPESANALDIASLFALCDAFDGVAKDAKVRCVVICAAGGRHFCAGADTREPKSEQRAKDFRSGLKRLLNAIFRVEKPIVAAIDGAASGAGAMIALATDQAIMADDTFFSFPEIDVSVPPLLAFDLIAECGGTGLARELVVTGRRIGASDCLHYGLVSQLVQRTEVRPVAEKLAQMLAAKPVEAYAAFKRHLATRYEPIIERCLPGIPA